jgi:methionyl-tRNA synthetase
MFDVNFTATVANGFDNLLIYKSVDAICSVARQGNGFIQFHEPWNLHEGVERDTIFFVTYETARICATLLQPIVPEYADRALTRLGVNIDERSADFAQFNAIPSLSGRPLGKDCGPLFPRLSVAKE